MELAREGDEDAMEQVLGGVVAPLFDLALHRYRQPVRAELATVEGLQLLVSALRQGDVSPSPVAVAARGVLRSGAETRPASIATDLERSLEALSVSQRTALLAAASCDLDAEELGHALEMDLDQAEELHREAATRFELDPAELRDALDQVAGRTPLPTGLVERALG